MDSLKKLTLFEYKPKSMLVTKKTDVDKAKFSVVDAHNHLGKFVKRGADAIDALVEKMDACGVNACVDLDGGTKDNLDRHMEALTEKHPGRFFVFAGIDFSNIDDADFGEKAALELERAAKMGACGLKIFKTLGLGVKDKNGEYVRVDTPKMDDVWSACAELSLPVMIHISDPKAFFTPLDRHNERLEELIDHPDWMFDKPQYPKKESLLEQRNRLLERHPNTTFIGAHVANLAEDLEQVSAWLDRYPNLMIDLSARLSELGRQPYSARRFISQYADRILFGTDGNAMDQPIEAMYRTHWRFFETDDEYFDVSDSHRYQARWHVHGLYLPDEVLQKIYYKNACRLLHAHKT